MKAIALFYVSLMLLLPAGAAAADEQKTETYKVGVVLPLTAASESIGQCVRNSILLAAKERGEGSGVEFIFEDDGLQAAKTVPAVRKLVELDRVKALIIYGTPTSLAVNEYAEAHKIPMIALSIHSQVVTGKQYVVKHWVPSRVLNAAIVDEVRRRNYRRIAILSALNSAMLELRDHFISNNPAEVVLNEEVAMADVDFHSLATKIRALNPDAVYVLLWSPQPGIFTKTLRQAGYRGDLFGAHNFANLEDVKLSQGAMENAWLVVGDDSKSAYRASYEKAYHEPPAPGGSDGYDAAALLLEAVRQGDVNGYLHRVRNFKGAFGTYGATGMNDFDLPAALRIVRNGELR